MGAWLGTIGGAGMIALIAVLFFVFLRQIGVSLPSEAPRSMAAACAVALAELMFAAKTVAGSTYITLAPYTVAAVIYFCINYPASKAIEAVERRMRRGDRK